MGSGFRVWTAGEVVSASNVNNYLQEQTVMSFAGTAARSSAIASPEEGMLSYLQDTDTYQGYDGSAWVNLGTLSGASDSGLIHIVTVTDSAVSAINLDSAFTTDYTHYKIVFSDLITSAGNTSVDLRLRASGVTNSSSNYERQLLIIDNTSVSASRATTTFWPAAASNASSVYADINLYYPAHTQRTSIITTFPGDSASQLTVSLVGRTTVTTSYDGLSVICASGTFTGSVSIFAYKGQ